MASFTARPEHSGPLPNHGSKTWVYLSALAVVTAALIYAALKTFQPSSPDGPLPLFVVCLLIGILLVSFWLGLLIFFRRKIPRRDLRMGPTPPYNAEDYAAAGLGALSSSDPARDLYLDLMKRCVINVLYEDHPVLFMKPGGKFSVAQEFDLHHRVNGTDGPTQAHTMIGLRRLTHVQNCIEQIVEDNVPGDFAETGSFRGGATIFMKAMLRAFNVTDRKIFVCDAFVPPQPDLLPWFLLPFLQLVASIPGKANKRRIFRFLERMPQKHRAFPQCENPDDDWIEFVLWALRHPETIKCGDTTSLDHVKSRFARYGLLDDQVVFVPGYFADTLPTAPIGQLSLLRLDGDTYESTHDAIIELYPKLAPGGYCIIDDYHAFTECARAVEDYRIQHGIDEEIQTIDDCGAFWRRSL